MHFISNFPLIVTVIISPIFADLEGIASEILFVSILFFWTGLLLILVSPKLQYIVAWSFTYKASPCCNWSSFRRFSGEIEQKSLVLYSFAGSKVSQPHEFKNSKSRLLNYAKQCIKNSCNGSVLPHDLCDMASWRKAMRKEEDTFRKHGLYSMT